MASSEHTALSCAESEKESENFSIGERLEETRLNFRKWRRPQQGFLPSHRKSGTAAARIVATVGTGDGRRVRSDAIATRTDLV